MGEGVSIGSGAICPGAGAARDRDGSGFMVKSAWIAFSPKDSATSVDWRGAGN